VALLTVLLATHFLSLQYLPAKGVAIKDCIKDLLIYSYKMIKKFYLF
jgi:hypothetical protein